MSPRSLCLGLIALTLRIAGPAISAQSSGPKFTPPELTAAGDMNYPIDSVASGVVEVAIRLDGAGSITGTDVLRDIPSLTASVLLAIPHWTFQPATLNGKGIDSTVVASIVFNPKDYGVGGAKTPVPGKEFKVLTPDTSGFVPPKMITPAWAQFPPDSVVQGAVILDGQVSAEGRLTDVVTIWHIRSLTDTSIEAAKQWTFSPATLNGTRIAACEVIGYVFRVTNVAKPPAP